MALCISIGDDLLEGFFPDYPCVVFVSGDGTFAYLGKCFLEIERKTGKTITPFGACEFRARELSIVKNILLEWLHRAMQEDDLITVRVAEIAHPHGRVERVFAELSRNRLVKLLRNILEIFDLAISERRAVLCIGD